MLSGRKPRRESHLETSVVREINRLRQMTVAELQAEWFRQYGEPTRSRNRTYLWKRLAWRIQEMQHGGLSDRARSRIEELAPDGFVRARTPDAATTKPHAARECEPEPRRDPRVPPAGSVITRSYRGRELRLVVRDDGFELDGQAFGSLSEAARHVTGSRWNGPLFWGLTKRKRG